MNKKNIYLYSLFFSISYTCSAVCMEHIQLSLNSLPYELITSIARPLSTKDRNNLRLVSKLLASILVCENSACIPLEGDKFSKKDLNFFIESYTNKDYVPGIDCIRKFYPYNLDILLVSALFAFKFETIKYCVEHYEGVLIRAALEGNIEVVQREIHEDTQVENLYLPLYASTIRGYAPIVNLLLQALKEQYVSPMVMCAIAVSSGHKHVVETFLEKFVIKHDSNYVTMIRIAVIKRYVDIARILLEEKEVIFPEQCEGLLNIARTNNDLAMINLLSKYKADKCVII